MQVLPADASSGYAATIDPNLDRVRLFDLAPGEATGDGRRRAAHRALADRPAGPERLCPGHHGDGHTAHGSGHVGLLAFNGTALFQGMTLKGLDTALQGWRTAAGSWEPDVRGVRGASEGLPAGADAARFVPAVASDVVASLDLNVATPATAAVVVRSAPDGTGGTELRVDPGAGTVLASGAGLAGTFDKDSTAMSAAAYSDVRVAATVRFGGGPYSGALRSSDQVPARGYGGAGSVLLRASDDGATAYYVNLGPNLRLARIFKLQNGVFNPAGSVLASVPPLLSHGVSYRLEAAAAGERLTVKLDGADILSVDDASLSSGKVGVNVFDGRAAYQDVLVTGSGQSARRPRRKVNNALPEGDISH